MAYSMHMAGSQELAACDAYRCGAPWMRLLSVQRAVLVSHWSISSSNAMISTCTQTNTQTNKQHRAHTDNRRFSHSIARFHACHTGKTINLNR